MNILLLSSAILHAVFAVSLVSIGTPPALSLTYRRQFNEWNPLLDLFRTSTEEYMANSTVLAGRAQELAWCTAPALPNTTRAPFCSCVAKASQGFTANYNMTRSKLLAARTTAAMDVVACLRDRTVWRVYQAWSIRFSVPAVFAMFVTFCFLWVSVDLPDRYVTPPLWAVGLGLIIALAVQDVVHNTFWSCTLVVVLLLLQLMLVPGMAESRSPPPEAVQLIPKVLAEGVQKVPSCFWWCEYFVAPIYALYVPLMHCGRDLYFTAIFTMVGTAIGGLGLRSFWCYKAYNEEPKSQYVSLMQYIVWLGILASCISLSFFTGVYYNQDAPYVMGAGSVALLVLTFCVSLLQWPGNQHVEGVLYTQMSLALVRNVVLFGLVTADVLRK
jgi:hypothetical protein